MQETSVSLLEEFFTPWPMLSVTRWDINLCFVFYLLSMLLQNFPGPVKPIIRLYACSYCRDLRCHMEVSQSLLKKPVLLCKWTQIIWVIILYISAENHQSVLDFPTSLQTQGNCLKISILISLGLYILLPRGMRSAADTMYGNAPTYTTQLINNLTSSYRAPGFDPASYPSYNQVCPFFVTSHHFSSSLVILSVN